jgi:hypothetical protein
VKSTVPEEYWGQIVATLDQVKQDPEALDAETDDDDEVFDPGDCDDIDDEFRSFRVSNIWPLFLRRA